jgi:hypothetical protein
MKASKEQLVLSGIFVMGVIALGIDRFVLSDGVSGPAQAAALPTMMPVASVSLEQDRASSAMGQRLRALATYEDLDLGNTPNAFSLDDRDAALRPPQTTESMSTSEQAFRASHRLMGVMSDRSSSDPNDATPTRVAFIEVLGPGESKPQITRLSEGDVVEGFTVVQLGLPGTDNAPSPFITLARNGVTFRLFTSDGS